MHKIDSPSATPTMPTPNPQGPGGYFVHGNGTTVPCTVLTSDWANAVQMEIVNVIEEAGLPLSKTNQSQLLAAIKARGYLKLTADKTLHVSPSGSDTTGDGLTLATAFKTIQRAITLVNNFYDLNGYTLTIKCEDTSTTPYTLGATFDRHYNGAMNLIGNPANPTACKIVLGATGGNGNAGVTVRFGAHVYVSGFAFEAASGGSSIWNSAGVALYAERDGTVYFDQCAFGPCQFHLAATGGAILISGPNKSYSIYGGASIHIYANVFGCIQIPSTTVTITGAPAFTVAFVQSDAGFVWSRDANWIGGTTATGTKFVAKRGGLISTQTLNITALPGSLPGDSTTGYYD